MQDAIILYENGKAIGGEGHPTDADDITFDNTGTDLVSENVEGAIKEVNERTKHGIVELWKNSNIGANFAGQTITINNFDSTKYDAIVLVVERYVGEIASNIWTEYDLEAFSANNLALESMAMAGGADVLYYATRTLSFSLSGTTLSITFGDATLYINSAGTPSSQTANEMNVPVRILGLIHNS